MFGGESDDRSVYAPTYYPASVNAAEAQPVTVGVGQHVLDLTIAVSPVPSSRVSGSATDADGRPLVGQNVVLYQRSIGIIGGTASVKADGTFTISNVPPGEYTAVTQSDTGATDPRETALTMVSVAGADVNDLRLKGEQPVIVSGRIIADDVRSGPLPEGIRVALEAANFDEDWFGAAIARAREDGSFETPVRPTHTRLRLEGLPQPWALKQVILRGADVTDRDLDVRPGEPVSNVQVLVTKQVSALMGKVTDGGGRPMKDFSVVVFPSDSEQWRFASRYIAVGRPDQDGRFAIRGLPAAEYFAVAIPYLEQGAQYDREFLDRLRSNGSRLALAEGETRRMTLILTDMP